MILAFRPVMKIVGPERDFNPIPAPDMAVEGSWAACLEEGLAATLEAGALIEPSRMAGRMVTLDMSLSLAQTHGCRRAARPPIIAPWTASSRPSW
jgi:hypothetical protein